jgi:predicted secreted protein
MQMSTSPPVQPKRVTVKVGEVHSIRLRGRGSAGFVWDLSIEGPPGVVSVTHTTVGNRPSAAPGGPPPSSYSLDDQFQLKGESPGSVRLHFVQHRPWETEKPPASEFDIEVTVSKP